MTELYLYKREYSENADKLTEIKPLTSNEVEFISKNSSLLIDFQKHHALIEYVILNYKVISETLVNLTKKITSAEQSSLDYPFENFYLEVNSVILNFLASARTFLDHMATSISRKYTEQSKQFSYFNEIASKEYDTTFSYKFMSRLRNYVQHCGMPPLSYNFQKSFDYDNLIVESNLVVYFEREHLLGNFSKWGKIVKQALLEQDEKFPAIPLINEYIYSLVKIHVNFTREFYMAEILEAKDNILSVINEKEGYSSNGYCFGKITPNGDSIRIEISTIPTSLLSKIYHFTHLQYLLEAKKNKYHFQYGEL
ncbi:hypothetical protein ACLMPP_11455 [Yersinia enterocolitica]|uniref:hypothetical protein n=1 Tax=Yersinia enterocolitica TaxID=630 RepID=UPI00398CED49